MFKKLRRDLQQQSQNKHKVIVKEVEHESQVEYTVQNFKNSTGQLDYTKAPGYDEDIVRSNINKVRHSS
jgi:hypothetical protein